MLAQADIDIAMGAGTDVAKETGGIVLAIPIAAGLFTPARNCRSGYDFI